MDRIEDILTASSWESCHHCEYDQQNLTRLMEEMRLVSNIGQRDLAIHMYEEIDRSTTNRVIFDFHTLLNSVENLQFQQAAKYFTKPRTTDWRGEYFT